MINKFIKSLKSKKGASMVEFTGVLFLFVILLSAGYEFFMMGNKYMAVSNYANDLARTISIQGGVENMPPKGFQGAGTQNNEYKTSADIMKSVEKLGAKIGQDPEDISVYIKYQPNNDSPFVTKKLNGGSSIEIPYGDRFEVKVDYVFRLELLNQITKLTDSKTVERTKGGVSEFEHNYDALD